MIQRPHRLPISRGASCSGWGASGSVRIAPGTGGLGLSLTLSPTWGVASSGTERLWSLPNAEGLAANGEFEANHRLDAEVGYGLGVARGLGVVTPYAGLGLAGEGGPSWRMSARWQAARGGERRRRARDPAALSPALVVELIRYGAGEGWLPAGTNRVRRFSHRCASGDPIRSSLTEEIFHPEHHGPVIHAADRGEVGDARNRMLHVAAFDVFHVAHHGVGELEAKQHLFVQTVVEAGVEVFRQNGVGEVLILVAVVPLGSVAVSR